MVNHVKNLLLTARSGAFDLPNWVIDIDSLIFPRDIDRTARATSMYALLQVEELRKYITRFDPRLDSSAQAENGIVHMCRTTYEPGQLQSLSSAIADSLHAAAVVDKLFSWDDQTEDLHELRIIYDNSCEWSMRMAAFVLAFAYQLERYRR